MQASLTRTGFAGTRVAARPTRALRASARGPVRVAAAGGYNWLNKDPLALLIGFGGWFVPSNLGVQTFGGKSLFGAFMERIGDNLSTFPAPPALDDKFWLYLITWHVGLFVTLTLAQIGVQGRKQQYW